MSKSGRDFATGKNAPAPEKCAEALDLMEKALLLIDHHDGPHDVGAHLDLAVSRLKEWIEQGGH